MARERARARGVPSLQELNYFRMADFTAAPLAWRGLAETTELDRDCDEEGSLCRIPRVLLSGKEAEKTR